MFMVLRGGSLVTGEGGDANFYKGQETHFSGVSGKNKTLNFSKNNSKFIFVCNYDCVWVLSFQVPKGNVNYCWES